MRWFLFAMGLANISGAMLFPLLPVYLMELVGAWFPFALTGAASLLTALPTWLKFRLEAAPNDRGTVP